MNAYQGKKIRMAAFLLAAAMMTTPVLAMAAETSAHVPGSHAAQETVEKISFARQTAFRGVSVSREWLRQVRLGGVMLNIRLHTPMGDEIAFREMLKAAPSDVDSMCLYLQASRSDDAITMQLDQSAIDALNNLGIVEIVLADENRNVRAHYMVGELEAVRGALGLEAAELLCVSGEDAPVTVVSEDGVRRQVNP